MKRALSLLPALLSLLFVPVAARSADAPDAAEKKLRETLRNTMVQLRAAQDQNAALQASLDAAQADAAKAKADLGAKVDALSRQLADTAKQAAADKAASDRALAGANAQLAERVSQISQLSDALVQWKDAYSKAAEIARQKEAERARLYAQSVGLQQQVDDDMARNVDLYKTAMEILTRFENFSLGDALAAKEPFVGAARVKLQNLVQKYQDRITAQKMSELAKTSPQ